MLIVNYHSISQGGAINGDGKEIKIQFLKSEVVAHRNTDVPRNCLERVLLSQGVFGRSALVGLAAAAFSGRAVSPFSYRMPFSPPLVDTPEAPGTTCRRTDLPADHPAHLSPEGEPSGASPRSVGPWPLPEPGPQCPQHDPSYLPNRCIR